jgi:Big-like domain-containing protein
MHRDRFPVPARQRLRVFVGAAVMAIVAVSGFLVGPSPQQVRAGLIATGVDDSQTVKHDRTTVIPAPGVLGNDLNLLGGTEAILVSGVSHGTLELRGDGGYTYTPAARYLGTDTFRYRPSGLLSTPATVTITITNASPVARPDAYSMASRRTLDVPAPGVLANDTDADADALVAELVDGGISGSLDLNPNGAFRYTPGGGFSGTATFSYRVSDGLAWSAATTVTLTVAAPTPTPTPTPIVPLPTPSASLPLPTLPLPSLPLPSSSATASPSTSPGATASPRSSATPAPGQSGGDPTPSESAVALPSDGSGTDGGPPSPSSGGSTGAGSGDPEDHLPSIRFDERRLDLDGASVGLLAGVEIWAVPAATIALPGLLVLIWVVLQAVGAMAWIPAARRLRGEDRARHRARGT